MFKYNGKELDAAKVVMFPNLWKPDFLWHLNGDLIVGQSFQLKYLDTSIGCKICLRLFKLFLEIVLVAIFLSLWQY